MNDIERLQKAIAIIQKKRMSDEAFFGRWDTKAGVWAVTPVLRYDVHEGLSVVAAEVKKGDYDSAKQTLLSYYRSGKKRPKPEIEPVASRGKYMAEVVREEIYQMYGSERSLTAFTVNDQWQKHSIDLKGQLYSTYGMMDWTRQGLAGIRSRENDAFAPALEIVTDKNRYVLKAAADTYLRAGEYSKSNFGEKDVLLCQESGTPIGSDTMRPYICFDLPPIDGDIQAITLHVYARSMGTEKNMSLLVLGSGRLKFIDRERNITWSDHRPHTFSYKDMEYDWGYPPGTEYEWLNYTSRLGSNNTILKYLETGDESYAFAALYRALNFFAQQNAGYPRSLEAAGRGNAIPRIFLHLLDSRHMTPDAAVSLLKFAHATGDYLEGCKESFGNWATSIQTAWMCINTYLPEVAKEDWPEANAKKMSEVIRQSVQSDGAYGEACAGYLHGVLSLNIKPFLSMAALSDQNIPEMEETYRRLAAYYRDTSMPGGVRIRWGDGGGDSAQAHVLDAGMILNDPELLYFGSNGEQGVKPQYTSTCYPAGKVVALRTSWLKQDGLGAFMNARTGGQHAHPDALHLDIYAYGRYLLTDPGTGSYDDSDVPAQWQRTTTIAHNTIEIDGRIQPRTDGNGGIKLTPSRTVDGHTVGAGHLFDHVTGWHTAYEGFRHERRVLFVRPSHWIVSDHITAPGGKHVYRQTWHPDLHNNVKLEKSTKTAKSKFSSGPNIQIVPADPETLKATIDDGYMTEIPTKYVTYCKEDVEGNVLFDTVIYPTREGENTSVTVRRAGASAGNKQLKPTEATALEINIGNDRKAVYCQSYIDQQVPVRFANHSFDGDMIYFERSHNGGLYVAMLGGSTLSTVAGNAEQVFLKSRQKLKDLGLRLQDGVMEIESTAKGPFDLIIHSAAKLDKVVLNGENVAFSQEDGVIRIQHGG
jgi:hypothetical protein